MSDQFFNVEPRELEKIYHRLQYNRLGAIIQDRKVNAGDIDSIPRRRVYMDRINEDYGRLSAHSQYWADQFFKERMNKRRFSRMWTDYNHGVDEDNDLVQERPAYYNFFDAYREGGYGPTSAILGFHEYSDVLQNLANEVVSARTPESRLYYSVNFRDVMREFALMYGDAAREYVRGFRDNTQFSVAYVNSLDSIP